MLRSERDVSKRQRSPSLGRVTDRSIVKRQCGDYYTNRLTREALVEHDRHTRRRTGREAEPPRRSKRLQQLVHHKNRLTVDEKPHRDLRRFARGGGPDITSIRGYLDPRMSHHVSRHDKGSIGSGSTTPSSRRSGPYGADYQMKLAQAGIFLTEETDKNNRRMKPANHSDIIAKLNKRRSSLSPSRFTEQDFENFQDQTEKEMLESETMSRSMTIIEGTGLHLSRIGGQFNNLEPFDPDMTMAVPDSYDGAPSLSIDHRVLNDLNHYIVPNTDSSRPAVPNFFLEGKSRKGRADVAKRQAAHTGAIGARGILSLQSYPSQIPKYDRNAYSFTSTYHDGQLKIYTTHVTAPQTPVDRPSYYMTQLNTFGMTGNSKTFREGATLYRNARDLAMEQRDTFVQQANQAARQMSTRQHSTRSRTATNTISSVRTDSPEQDTDTSTDELAHDDTSSKRSRTELFNVENSVPVSPCIRPDLTLEVNQRRSKKPVRQS